MAQWSRHSAIERKVVCSNPTQGTLVPFLFFSFVQGQGQQRVRVSFSCSYYHYISKNKSWGKKQFCQCVFCRTTKGRNKSLIESFPVSYTWRLVFSCKKCHERKVSCDRITHLLKRKISRRPKIRSAHKNNCVTFI